MHTQDNTSDFHFAYNPSYMDLHADGLSGDSPTGALVVRVQDLKGQLPLPAVCAAPTHGFAAETPSSLAFAPIHKEIVGRLGRENIIIGPADPKGPFGNESDIQDPRIVWNKHDGLFYLYYTAISPRSSPPVNRIQCLATAHMPLDANNWTRHGPCIFNNTATREDSGNIVGGIKSGAVIINDKSATGPHYMMVYDLLHGRYISIAESSDLHHWHLRDLDSSGLPTQVITTRRGFDSGLTEPGPPPLLLSVSRQIKSCVYSLNLKPGTILLWFQVTFVFIQCVTIFVLCVLCTFRAGIICFCTMPQRIVAIVDTMSGLRF